MRPNLLVVEDEPKMGKLLISNLCDAGYNPILAKNGIEAISMFRKNKIDLCILDVMMPKMDGFCSAKEIRRADPLAPFLFLTAKNSQADKAKGFEIGCDDYVVKPFVFAELTLRINAILDRTRGPLGRFSKILDFEYFKLNLQDRVLEIRSDKIKLTRKEMHVLHVLSSNFDSTVSRQDILEKVWGSNDIYHSRSLDVYLNRIRKYFDGLPNVSINNVYGHGFSMTLNT